MTKMNIVKALFTLSMATVLGFGVHWAFEDTTVVSEKDIRTMSYFEDRMKETGLKIEDRQYIEHVEFNEYTGLIYVVEVLEDESGIELEERDKYYISGTHTYINSFFVENGIQYNALKSAQVYFNGIEVIYGTYSAVGLPEEETEGLRGYAKTVIPTMALGLFMLWAFPMTGKKDEEEKSNDNKALITKSKPKKEYRTILGQSTVKSNVKSFLDIFLNPESYEKSKVELPNALFISAADDFRKEEFIKVIASEMKGTLYSVMANDIALQSGDDAVKTLKKLYSKVRFNKSSVIHIENIEALYNSGSVEQKVFEELKSLIDRKAKVRKTIIVLSSESDEVRKNKDYDKLNIAGYVNIPELSPKDREAIFKAALKESRVSKDVNYEELSKATVGFNDEKINRIVNQSLLRSVSNGNGILKMSDIKRILKTTK